MLHKAARTPDPVLSSSIQDKRVPIAVGIRIGVGVGIGIGIEIGIESESKSESKDKRWELVHEKLVCRAAFAGRELDP
jgi:hypothetical protein